MVLRDPTTKVLRWAALAWFFAHKTMPEIYRAFDGQAPWASEINRGYDIDISIGEGNWRPEITVSKGEERASYVFVQSADDKGTFTPGYAVAHTEDPLGERDAIVRSLPDEEPVKPWMIAAIERAGFDYNPVPNNERIDAQADVVRTRADQTELVVHG